MHLETIRVVYVEMYLFHPLTMLTMHMGPNPLLETLALQTSVLCPLKRRHLQFSARIVIPNWNPWKPQLSLMNIRVLRDRREIR